jgi:hypothetical protein
MSTRIALSNATWLTIEPATRRHRAQRADMAPAAAAKGSAHQPTQRPHMQRRPHVRCQTRTHTSTPTTTAEVLPRTALDSAAGHVARPAGQPATTRLTHNSGIECVCMRGSAGRGSSAGHDS